MITMQQADLMVCNGGEMEQWVEKVVASLDTENMKVLTMMDYVDVLEEEIVEGMEDNEHSHDDHDHAHENGRKKIMITVKWIIVALTMR